MLVSLAQGAEAGEVKLGYTVSFRAAWATVSRLVSQKDLRSNKTNV